MNMNRKYMILVIFILGALIASGCAVSRETMMAYNEAKEAFQRATLADAKKCAPCQFATAEAYLALADHEKSHFWRELERLDNHIKIVKEKSLEAIRICEKPPAPPAPPLPRPIAPPPVPPVPAPPAVVTPPPPPVPPAPPAPPPAPPVVITPPPPAPPPPPPAPEKPEEKPAPPVVVTPPPAPTPPAPAPPKRPEVPVFETVYFDLKKTNINPSASKALDRNGMILRENPNIRVVIEGHTDSTGSPETNKVISEKRAESAKKYIQDKFGISADRMQVKGFGATRPVADNRTEEGRAKNRRVEFRIIP